MQQWRLCHECNTESGIIHPNPWRNSRRGEISAPLIDAAQETVAQRAELSPDEKRSILKARPDEYLTGVIREHLIVLDVESILSDPKIIVHFPAE